MKTVFTGFDSAWGGRAPGAVCDLLLDADEGQRGLKIVEEPKTVLWDEALDRFKSYYTSTTLHVVAIDQGLVVPNETGMRPVEQRFAKAMMSKYRCGAHASNKSNTSCYGANAGIWKLLKVLNNLGYLQSPEKIASGSCVSGKYFFECYPHPAIIGLFQHDRVLQYKAHKRNKADWELLVRNVRELGSAEFPVANIGDIVVKDYAQSKQNEDRLDSIIAAYTAAWLWKYHWTRSMCIGDAFTGYFVTPANEDLRATLNRVFPKHVLVDFGLRENNCWHTDSEHPKSISVEPMASRKDYNAHTLKINDAGCIWGKLNNWMIREFCEGHVLEIHIVGIPEEPTVRFIQFEREGQSQYGMRIDEESKLVWKHIAHGCSNSNTIELIIEFQYHAI